MEGPSPSSIPAWTTSVSPLRRGKSSSNGSGTSSEHGVAYTPIRDEHFGSHLNFRDPDDIALEFTSSNELMIAAQRPWPQDQMTSADIAAFIAENVDPSFVPGIPSGSEN